MSVTSGFFNSINGDRTYNAEQMSSIFDGIINDGVFANIGTAFSVQATTGNTVNVGTGRCWFDSTWLLNDATLPIELDDAEVLLDRIDAIVIEINHSESIRAGSIKVVNGTPSSTPTNPTMTHTDYINQYPIAYIMRSANSDSITQANITYVVGSNACPFITGILSVVSIQNIVAQWENEFDTWLDGLSAMLDDNTAANLANQILELKEQFDTLAKEKKIYSELEDSTGEDTIDDSTGAPILGTTAMYSDDGTSESIPGTVTGGDPYKVGDTLTTARTDLGAKWLLCNGDALDRDLYPELANVLPNLSSVGEGWNQMNIPNNADANKVMYENNYWILLETVQVSSSNYTLRLHYATSLTGEWQQVDVVTNFRFVSTYGLKYINDRYIIYGTCRTSNYSGLNAGFIAYASELTGPWTINTTLTSTSGSSSLSRTMKVNALAYGDGRYVICGQGYQGGGIDRYRTFVGTSTDLNTWTVHYIWVSANDTYDCDMTDIIYANGYFVTVGYERPTGEEAIDIKIAYTSDPGHSYADWTDVTLFPAKAYSPSWYSLIRYINNTYVVVCSFSTSTQEQGDAITLAHSSSVAGSWTLTTVVSNDGAGYDNATELAYVNGQYIISGGHEESGSNRKVCYWTSDSLSGTWTVNYPVDSGTYGSDCMYSLVYANGIYAGTALIKNSSSTTVRYIIYQEDNPQVFLPSISLSDKTYTYIRAKE